MAVRTFSHYTATVTAGPILPVVDIVIEYYDDDGEFIGCWGQELEAFGCTWRDLGTQVLRGMQLLALDVDPLTNQTIMVDLT
jgi:hypothetical protein